MGKYSPRLRKAQICPLAGFHAGAHRACVRQRRVIITRCQPGKQFHSHCLMIAGNHSVEIQVLMQKVFSTLLSGLPSRSCQLGSHWERKKHMRTEGHSPLAMEFEWCGSSHACLMGEQGLGSFGVKGRRCFKCNACAGLCRARGRCVQCRDFSNAWPPCP